MSKCQSINCVSELLLKLNGKPSNNESLSSYAITDVRKSDGKDVTEASRLSERGSCYPICSPRPLHFAWIGLPNSESSMPGQANLQLLSTCEISQSRRCLHPNCRIGCKTRKFKSRFLTWDHCDFVAGTGDCRRAMNDLSRIEFNMDGRISEQTSQVHLMSRQ